MAAWALVGGQMWHPTVQEPQTLGSAYKSEVKEARVFGSSGLVEQAQLCSMGCENSEVWSRYQTSLLEPLTQASREGQVVLRTLNLPRLRHIPISFLGPPETLVWGSPSYLFSFGLLFWT